MKKFIVALVLTMTACSAFPLPPGYPTPIAATETPAVAAPQNTATSAPPQPQLRHPTQYLETGVGNAKSWTFQLGADEVLIVGGFAVDGVDGGVYKAWQGSQEVTVSVTDGFALVIADEWARDEFCFRVGQAVQYGWAHKYVEPLTGWSACG